jgi:DNA-binding HxlR family transcriptional regulator
MEKNRGYGQFCPVARAAEILAERWTPLVIRELLSGSVRFNDLQRGVPRMSSSLLSRRLKELEFSGIVERRTPDSGGRGAEYHLTPAGHELFSIVEGMGTWAQRWLRDDLTQSQNLDPDLLMWDVRRCVIASCFQEEERNTVRFQFTGVPSSKQRYWLVFDHGETDLCLKDPGFDVDLYVHSSLRTLVEIWLGHVSIETARQDGALRLEGTRGQIGKFTEWFALSHFAPVGAEPPGQTV